MIERKANCQGHDGSKGYVRAHKIIVEIPLYERGGRRGRGEKKRKISLTGHVWFRQLPLKNYLFLCFIKVWMSKKYELYGKFCRR